MVDRAGLENRSGFTPTVGSNPTLSAIKYLKFQFIPLITLDNSCLTSAPMEQFRVIA